MFSFSSNAPSVPQGAWAYRYWNVEKNTRENIIRLGRLIGEVIEDEFHKLTEKLQFLRKSRMTVYDPEDGQIQVELVLPVPVRTLQEKPDISDYVKSYNNVMDRYVMHYYNQVREYILGWRWQEVGRKRWYIVVVDTWIERGEISLVCLLPLSLFSFLSLSLCFLSMAVREHSPFSLSSIVDHFVMSFSVSLLALYFPMAVREHSPFSLSSIVDHFVMSFSVSLLALYFPMAVREHSPFSLSSIVDHFVMSFSVSLLALYFPMAVREHSPFSLSSIVDHFVMSFSVSLLALYFPMAVREHSPFSLSSIVDHFVMSFSVSLLALYFPMALQEHSPISLFSLVDHFFCHSL